VSCERIENLWRLYVSGDLSKAKRRRFDGHLEGCAECRARKEAFDRSVELAMREMPAPAELTPIEWNRVRPDTRTPVSRGRRPLAAALAAAACAAVVGAVLYFAPRASVDDAMAADAGVALKDHKPLRERDRYEVRMCTEDPKVKIVWVFDRNLTL
jgi:anti-sigma factor RsiW